jgi:cytochrome b
MNDGNAVRVWDIVVRTLHWSLVVCFVTAYASGDDESRVHAVLGYLVLAIVSVRVVWGFVGTKYARFTDFVRGREETLRYARSLLARRPIHYVGHNPLGGWMIVALLVTLLATCWTGLEAEAVEGRGPLAQASGVLVATAAAHEERARRGEKRQGKQHDGWGEVHEILSHLALVLALVHIAGVVVGSALHRENLIKAMITGVKER